MFKSKFVTTLIGASALILTLTACSSEEAPTPVTPSATASAPASEPTEDPVTELTVGDYAAGDIINPEGLSSLGDVYAFTLPDGTMIAVDPSQPFPEQVVTYVKDKIAADYQAVLDSGPLTATSLEEMSAEQQAAITAQALNATELAKQLNGTVTDPDTGVATRKVGVLVIPSYGELSVGEEYTPLFKAVYEAGGLDLGGAFGTRNATQQGMIDELNTWIMVPATPLPVEIITWAP